MAKVLDAVIFDWAGTTVDFGSMSPVAAFMEAFKSYGIEVTEEETRMPMGMLKREHIKTMLNMPRIAKAFSQKYGRAACDNDIDEIYNVFEPSLFEVLPRCSKLKPFVLEAVNYLHSLNVKIGSTTGYTASMMQVVTDEAQKQGYKPDCMVTPDMVQNYGRPYPYMIFENMRRLAVKNVKHIIKIGDTASDIEEALNAGVFAVGVCEGSSVLGLSENEYYALGEADRQLHRQKAKAKFYSCGADFVIDDLSKISKAIEAFYQK